MARIKGQRLVLALLLLNLMETDSWLFSVPGSARVKESPKVAKIPEGRIGATRPASRLAFPRDEAETVIDAYSTKSNPAVQSGGSKSSYTVQQLLRSPRLKGQGKTKTVRRGVSSAKGTKEAKGGNGTKLEVFQRNARVSREPAPGIPARGGLRVQQRNRVSDRTMIGTLDVPHLGIGTIGWTPESPEDEQRFGTIAKAAMDSGLTLFDTAERYGAKGSDLIPAAIAATGLPMKKSYLGGDTESRLGSWAKRGTVITKFAPTPWRGDSQSVVEACRGSAERLGVESVDLMQVHMPDIIQPFRGIGIENRREEAHWDGLAECYHQGLAKNVGVSNYGPTLLARCHEYLAKKGVPLASNQIHFNLLYRNQGSLKTVEACRELGVACLAYYPLAMGLLTGKLSEERLASRTDIRSVELLRYLEGGKGGGFPNTAGDIPQGGVGPLLEVVSGVAARLGKTPAQVSLNWIICKGAVPIPGASSVSQLEENGGALGWRLSDEDVALLDAAADSLDFEFNGCGFQTANSKFVGYGFERWLLD